MELRPRNAARQARSLWRRRNDAERNIRQAIGTEPGLSIFGIGLDRGNGRAGEVFVTLTAANDTARQAAPRLLNGNLGLEADDWAGGWSRLELGDWMIRVYPERRAS